MTQPTIDKPILTVENLSVHYGMIQALHNLSFSVPERKIVTLIGANGAGKTTTLKAISGLVRASSGRISFKDQDITNRPAHEIVRHRLCQAPEGRGIFLNLTVEENLDLGAWAAPDKAAYADNLAHAFDLFPRLKERRRQNSGTLSGGELQMLAIARALMSQPEMLLLDEPSLGLAPQVIEKIFEIIQKINREKPFLVCSIHDDITERRCCNDMEKKGLGTAFPFQAGQIVRPQGENAATQKQKCKNGRGITGGKMICSAFPHPESAMFKEHLPKIEYDYIKRQKIVPYPMIP